MRQRLALMSLILLCVAFAPAPLPRAKRKAEAAPSIEGVWRRVPSGGLVRITATTWTNGAREGGPPTFTVKTYPQASPPAFDLGNPGVQGVYLLVIYKIEGDKLTIMYDYPPKARPTAFEGPGRGAGTEEFTRVR